MKIGAILLAIGVVFVAILGVRPVATSAKASDAFVPAWANSVSLRLWPPDSTESYHHIGPITVSAKSVIDELQKQFDSYRVVKTKGWPACLRGESFQNMETVYELRFHFDRERGIRLEILCGVAARLHSNQRVYIQMPMAYALAAIMHRASHSADLCHPSWQGHRLSLCRRDV